MGGSLCRVAKMPKQYLTAKLEVVFHRPGKLRVNLSRINELLVSFQLAFEDTRERIRLCRALSGHIRLTGVDIEFHAANSCSVLPAVVLFLHEQKELIEAV